MFNFLTKNHINKLCIWNSSTNNLMKKMQLKVIPTACKFSPDGKLLVIGYLNGNFEILDFGIDQNLFKKNIHNLVDSKSNKRKKTKCIF